ncbi:hypothetical protein PMAYCL1PPCAC_17226, partial [Pristionchus mayeri]
MLNFSKFEMKLFAIRCFFIFFRYFGRRWCKVAHEIIADSSFFLVLTLIFVSSGEVVTITETVLNSFVNRRQFILAFELLHRRNPINGIFDESNRAENAILHAHVE